MSTDHSLAQCALPASAVRDEASWRPAPMLTAAQIVAGAAEIDVDVTGRPQPALVLVDLDQAGHADPDTVADAMRALGRRSCMTVGVMRDPERTPAHKQVEVLSTALDTSVCGPGGPQRLPRWRVRVEDVDAEVARLTQTANRVPQATVTLAGLLRLTETLSPRDGLIAESMAAAMLRAGAEFRDTWRPPTLHGEQGGVRVQRRGDVLSITVDSPGTGNRLTGQVREDTLSALRRARTDTSITRIDLAGSGPNFCEGGDVEHVVAPTDAPSAHLLGLTSSVGLAVHVISRRVQARLHGECVGSGIEVPAFAARVTATPDTTIRLPALSAGLVPCAGGCVSITARAGRWRTAYLALSDRAIDADTAQQWGLIDEVHA